MELKYDKKQMLQENPTKNSTKGNGKSQRGDLKHRGVQPHTRSSATYGRSMRSATARLDFRTGIKPNAQEQLASYAIEMFSARGVRRHVLGLLIDSLSVEFWYYDRSAGYGSVRCPFGENWESIAILLLAIGHASAENLGYEPHIKPPPDVASHPRSSILEEANKARIKVGGKEYEVEGEKLGRLRSLTGRGKQDDMMLICNL